MPANPRIRGNNAFGVTTDNPLTAAATTFNSNQLVFLPTVAVAHAVITLDPLRQYGDPEIVVVTTHTAAATVATITRGAYGTTARPHPQGTTWVHAAVNEDFISILTSNTRPTDPYRGEAIFETDNDAYMGRSVSDTWESIVNPISAWKTWTPTLTNLTLGNGTQSAVYHRAGRLINFRWKFTLGTTSAVGTSPQFTLPVAAHADFTLNMPIGSCSLLDTGVQLYIGWPLVFSSTAVIPVAISTSGAVAVNSTITATSPFTWGTGDVIMVVGTYEAAS